MRSYCVMYFLTVTKVVAANKLVTVNKTAYHAVIISCLFFSTSTLLFFDFSNSSAFRILHHFWPLVCLSRKTQDQYVVQVFLQKNSQISFAKTPWKRTRLANFLPALSEIQLCGWSSCSYAGKLALRSAYEDFALTTNQWPTDHQQGQAGATGPANGIRRKVNVE